MTTTTTNPIATRPVVVVEGLTKRYGTAAAVDALSFDVPAGQVTGLLGPNGAGKTTAMKMLLGLVRPTEGRATVLGVDHDSPEFAHAVQRVGALIEAPALYEGMSARRNLELQARALGVSADRERIDELLELVDLTERGGDRAKTYSLGMKQRLGIAIAMIGRPDLVILDEPANGLDPAGIVEIRTLLRRLADTGTTVLVSSHQLAEMQQAADRVVVLDRGRLVASGTTAEILNGHRGRNVTVHLDPADVGPAIDLLSSQSLTVTASAGDSLVVVLPDGWSGRDVNRSLADAGVYAIELVPETVTLESAFLEMTGARQ
ncbi:MAG: ABC transporter ATP-binding protein [Ilumatobacter sp.]|nr:ABC transporter ATP-binding protein [Ilumatobacter sp.]